MDKEDQVPDDIEALVSRAVEKASAERAATAATEAVTAKTPEIIAEVTKAANDTARSVITEVARGLAEKSKTEVEDEVRRQVEAHRSTFSILPSKDQERPYADQPGVLGGRIVRAFLLGDEKMSNVPEIIRTVYKDAKCADFVARTLETSNPTKGGLLVVPEIAVSEFIDRLYQEAVLFPLCRRIPMASGSVMIPGFSSGPNMGWVNETSNNRASSASFKGLTLNSKKAFVAVPISNDLLEEGSIDADMIVADDIVRVLAELVDSQLFNGTRTQYAPGGLFTNTLITNTSLGAAVDADLPATIVARVMARKVNVDKANFRWFFNHSVWEDFYNLKATTGSYLLRDEMDRGMLLGFPYSVTTHITNEVASYSPTKIVFGNPKEMFLGVNRELRFERSKEAAYYDENGNVAAAFSKDVTLIKGTFKMDAEVRRAEAWDITTNVRTAAS